jgi:hypothetical protein
LCSSWSRHRVLSSSRAVTDGDRRGVGETIVALTRTAPADDEASSGSGRELPDQPV